MFFSKEVKSTIQNVAASIAAAMDVDIMVIDDKRRIVGGTVNHETTYYVSQVYDYIMEKKEFFVIEDPGFNEVCRGCDFYGNCAELMELDAPILLQDQCIGILSVTAYKEEHRQNILRKKEDYIVFLKNMAELIASKIGEVKANNQVQVTALYLASIINSVSEGMIAVDEQGTIIHCNGRAAAVVKLQSDQLLGRDWADFFKMRDGRSLELKRMRKKETILHSSDGEETGCYISMDPIVGAEGEVLGTIILIEDTGNIKKLVGHVMGFNRKDFLLSDITGKSQKIVEAKGRAVKASATDSTLLIWGESGTGKELFARAVHNTSSRVNAPFVALNCAAIPDSLLESELFGYESGAFTGASREGKPGKFELADTGTIFLDEIGDMPIYLQAKLLRVLQEKTIQRIGGIKEKAIDIRVISATNKDLEKLVAQNRFREDLFYRLNVIPLKIPPLRERIEDVPLLVQHFLTKYRERLGKMVWDVDEAVMQIFINYQWPGNVRELENVVEYAMNMEGGETLTVESLPENLKFRWKQLGSDPNNLKSMLRRYESQVLEEKIQEYGRSLEAKNRIAQELGIGIATLYRKLRECGLE